MCSTNIGDSYTGATVNTYQSNNRKVSNAGRINFNLESRNIYEIFNHQIAYEIRLQNAMEEDLLCPFHYFGITDLERISDSGNKKEDK